MTRKTHPSKLAPSPRKKKPITWTTEEWPFSRFLSVTIADFNPKDAAPDEIASLAEDYLVFNIGRSFAVREDGLLLDGHQSLLAFRRLLDGEHLSRDVIVGGEPAPVVWTPPETLTIRVAHHMPDVVARAFIAALTKNRVDSDPLKYGALLLDISERIAAAPPDDREIYESALDAVGHDPDELADLIEAARNPVAPGARTKGAPRVTLDFSSRDLRDRVRSHLAEQAKKNEPAGNTLARLLGFRTTRSKKAKRSR